MGFFNSKPKRDKFLILHVDDEKLNRDLMQDILTDFGADAVAAESGADGIKLALKHLPDLILLDIRMPGVNGFDALTALKSNEDTKKIPVIMLSGLDQMKDVEKAFANGAIGYVTKPLQIDRLRATLERWLPKPADGPAKT